MVGSVTRVTGAMMLPTAADGGRAHPANCISQRGRDSFLGGLQPWGWGSWEQRGMVSRDGLGGIFSSLNGSMVLCLVHPAAGEMGSRNLMQLNQEWCRTPGQEQHSTAPLVCKAQVCLLLLEGGWGSAELKEPNSSSEKLGAGIAASKDGWKRHVLQETFSFPYPLQSRC